ADTFVIDQAALTEGPAMADLITDYNFASGDQVDLTVLLDGIGAGADINDYARTVEGGAGAADALQVSTTGNPGDFVTIAVLDSNAGVKILYNDDQHQAQNTTV